MPRKYSGPLLKGQRSAYVPGSRVNRTRRSTAARVVQRAWRRYTKRRPTVRRAPKVSMETKLKPGVRVIEQAPVSSFVPAIGTPSFIYQQVYDTGASGTGSLPEQLDCFRIRKGTDNDQRVGDYIYGRKVEMSVFIQTTLPDASALANQKGNLRFKVLVMRNRRSKAPVGKFMNPLTNCFLATNGDSIGTALSDGHPGPATNTQLMKVDDILASPINKKNFIIYKHYNFTLSPPKMILSGADQSTYGDTKQYPTHRLIKLHLPVWSKIHYENVDDSGTTTNLPDDFDGHFRVIIYAINMPNERAATYWETSVRSTFLFNDV